MNFKIYFFRLSCHHSLRDFEVATTWIALFVMANFDWFDCLFDKCTTISSGNFFKKSFWFIFDRETIFFENFFKRSRQIFKTKNVWELFWQRISVNFNCNRKLNNNKLQLVLEEINSLLKDSNQRLEVWKTSTVNESGNFKAKTCNSISARRYFRGSFECSKLNLLQNFLKLTEIGHEVKNQATKSPVRSERTLQKGKILSCVRWCYKASGGI